MIFLMILIIQIKKIIFTKENLREKLQNIKIRDEQQPEEVKQAEKCDEIMPIENMEPLELFWAQLDETRHTDIEPTENKIKKVKKVKKVKNAKNEKEVKPEVVEEKLEEVVEEKIEEVIEENIEETAESQKAKRSEQSRVKYSEYIKKFDKRSSRCLHIGSVRAGDDTVQF